MRVIKWLDEHFEEALLIIFLVLIACVMLAQVFMRKIVNSSLTWAEEFCRYCYVWTAFLSLGYTVKNDNMLRVGVVAELLPAAARKAVNMLVQLIMTGFFAVFAWQSVGVVSGIRGMGQTSTAMGLPMYLVYLCTVVGFTLGLLRSIQRLVRMITSFAKPDKPTNNG